MDLRVAPRDRFEASEGIRINDRWRVCFRWQGEDARDVEIVDYH
jgi:proteic killer suppression protein